ncbi:uncharacterized protein LOC124675660 isoform X3 [Lolium rigidum]|uniref:uncharacterized protein LOC124675660 isoform X3 n=1 Tax=Lolium rigidum TaxID=89674 RepID=UPI001F5C7304|nr:uncharacterized protein LOC124675660 isoform X3 [Lolium rigidum]
MAGRGRNGFEDDDVNPFANQDILLDLVIKGTEISITYWFFHIKLIDCISHFIYLFPDIAQDMTGHLLNMLHDTDYRVRLYLARKIVVLFQTWEGHNELFNDVWCKRCLVLIRPSQRTSLNISAHGFSCSLFSGVMLLILIGSPSYGLQQKGDEHLARRSSSRRRRSAPGRGAGGDHPPVCSWARTCLHRRISVLQ